MGGSMAGDVLYFFDDMLNYRRTASLVNSLEGLRIASPVPEPSTPLVALTSFFALTPRRRR
ncbi:MAG: hypothetical protein U0638_04100 [Phycisphaerales bacterium]